MRSVVRFAATTLATGFGAGYSPIAPGTAGTLVGLVLFWPMRDLPFVYQVAITLVMLFAGVAASTNLSRRIGIKDPPIVVVDEIVGMWISLLLLPWTVPVAIAAFFAFRLMDILKPAPARGFERLPDGWGIVLDDVMAGVYANLLVQVGWRAWLWWYP